MPIITKLVPKQRLVDDVERISKRASIIIAKLGAVASLGWAGLTAAGLTDKAPPWAGQLIAGLIFFGIAIAGYWKQKPPDLEYKPDDGKIDTTPKE